MMQLERFIKVNGSICLNSLLTCGKGSFCDTFMSLRQNFLCFPAPPSCMCTYGFYWSYENVIQRVCLWRRVCRVCDSVRNFILKASVFCYTSFLSLLCQKCDILCPVFTFMMSFWCKSFGFSPVVLAVVVFYWNNRWLQTYHRTCSFSNNPSLFREKMIVSTRPIYSPKVFLQWLLMGFWYYDVIIKLLLALHCHTLTGIFLRSCRFSLLFWVLSILCHSLYLLIHFLHNHACSYVAFCFALTHICTSFFHRRTISLRSLIIWVADNSLSRGKSCDP